MCPSNIITNMIAIFPGRVGGDFTISNGIQPSSDRGGCASQVDFAIRSWSERN